MNRSSKWLRFMLAAFVANGLGPFGLKIMVEMGLSERYRYQYLLWWYVGCLVLSLAVFVATDCRIHFQKLVIAFGVGMGSFGAQFFSLLALEQKVPGYIVFPLATGGSLVLVAAAGVLLFKEKIGGYGIAGIVTGVLALVLLSLD